MVHIHLQNDMGIGGQSDFVAYSFSFAFSKPTSSKRVVNLEKK